MADSTARATPMTDDQAGDTGAALMRLPPTLEPDDRPAEPPALDGPAGRYELLEEIDRGGMGAVLRARDRTLGREVAVKVLQQRFAAGTAIARRFVDEARIAGQLQHPGIPPVHDLGTLPDGRPFLAMKLIKGRTLDAMLRDRPDPSADRGRFLAAFEQACQAVAYAHSRRVIHRDLKPANVMVGAFGEVQVMDWGLAKVLGDRPAPAPEPPSDSDERLATEIRSGRDTEGSETQAGSVLGTPAYMAPEQAVGAVEQVDARSDVFGLGAILAVILTGRPPFVGDDAEGTRVLAARGKLDDCFGRLDACGAEPELVMLCKRCLSPEREDRPADAGAVAQAVAGLRAAAEERARRAEVERVRAEAEARAQRQKRRAQLAMAAGVLGLMAVGGVGWVAVRTQAEARRADADRVASVALGRAEQLASQAGAIDAGNLSPANEAVRLWEQAEAAIREAEAVLAGAGDAGLSARVKRPAASVRAGLARARRDAALLAALESAEGDNVGTAGARTDYRSTVRLYREALAAAGLPVDGDASALASAVAAERPGLREALVRALDRWAGYLSNPPDPDAGRVRAALDLADPDPIRKEVRAATVKRDRSVLARLGQRLRDADLDPVTAMYLGRSLCFSGDRGMAADGVRILRRSRDRHPSDFKLLVGLSEALMAMGRDDPALVEEAIGCAHAAVAARPELASGHYGLGQIYLFNKKDPVAAEGHYLRALERNPRFNFANVNLGKIRFDAGDLAGAERWIRKAIATDPKLGQAHHGLAMILEVEGDLAGAEAEYRKMAELEPGARKRLDDFLRRRPLLPKLDEILAGRVEPASPAEAIALARVCVPPLRRRYAAAVRLFERAFAADPKLADDLTEAHRYYAVCSAALAGCGQGTDAPSDPADPPREGPALAPRRPGPASRAGGLRQAGRPAAGGLPVVLVAPG